MRAALITLMAACFLWAAPLQADTPFFDKHRTVTLEDGSDVTVALWFGDGFIGPRPVRAVVLNSDRQMLSASPLGHAVTLRCTRTTLASCRVFDHATWEVTSFSPGKKAIAVTWTKEGHPRQHPEYLEDSFGITTEARGLGTALFYEAVAVIQNPAMWMMAVLWGAGIALLLLPTRKPDDWTRGAYLLTWALRVLLAGGMAYLGVIIALISATPVTTLFVWVGLSALLALCLRTLLRGALSPHIKAQDRSSRP